MSAKKKNENNEDAVIEKLDKVADTLESASSQLSNTVTQQQLDLARDRISTLEVDIEKIKESCEILAQRSASHANEADDATKELHETYKSMEKDFTGLRALVLSTFALATISLISLTLYAVFS